MKKIVQKIFRRLGFEIHRLQAASVPGCGQERSSLEGSLDQAKRAGVLPATVIDVGAAFGSFSRSCHEVFPQARCLLIEPLVEYVPSLTKVVDQIPGASYEIAVAAAEERTASLNVHQDLVGSSLYRESEVGTGVNGVPREVRAVTLDRLVVERQVSPPFLLKVDVQGAELDVLDGGQETLNGSELVILEVSLFQFFENGPLLHDVVAYMHSKGFVAYDVIGLQYRPLDRALSQIDIVFVKENGPLRRQHFYATPKQREEQNRQFRAHFTSLLSPGRPQ